MTPAMFRRGARSMGPQLLALMTEIGKAVRNHTMASPMALMKSDDGQAKAQKQVGCW